MVPTAAPGAGEVTEPSDKAVILVLSYDWVARLVSQPQSPVIPKGCALGTTCVTLNDPSSCHSKSWLCLLTCPSTFLRTVVSSSSGFTSCP